MEVINKNERVPYRQLDKDLLRIILVVLVVIGHGTYYDITTKFGSINYGILMSDASISDTMFHKITSILTNFIYTFHMPAFIALSGSLFSLKKNINTRGTIIKKAKRLLIPFIAVWIFWNLPVKYFSGYYHGVSIKGMLLQLIFPSCVYLWYLECLFFVFVIASFVCKLETKKQIIIVSFCWCIGVILYKGLDQYHVLGDPLYYLLWFYLGYRLENMIEWLKKHNIWKDSSILCLFGLVCLSFIVDKIVKIHFFHFLSSYIVCPFFMLIVLNYIVRHIKINGRAIKSLSDYGMGIYLYAEPLNYLFLFWFYRFCGIEFFGSEFGAAIIYFSRIVITPIIAIGITWILKKFNLKYLY